jgi:pimeloyl-ACP methyl ester carboxylesterase
MSATNEDQIEQAHDRVLFRLSAGSDTAIVAFGHRGASGVSAPYGPILEQLPATSQIVVRDPSSRWYQAGLPGIGETLEEIAERLKWEIAELGATRIVTFGSSMGGYAAILFGCLLDAERAICHRASDFSRASPWPRPAPEYPPARSGP